MIRWAKELILLAFPGAESIPFPMLERAECVVCLDVKPAAPACANKNPRHMICHSCLVTWKRAGGRDYATGESLSKCPLCRGDLVIWDAVVTYSNATALKLHRAQSRLYDFTTTFPAAQEYIAEMPHIKCDTCDSEATFFVEPNIVLCQRCYYDRIVRLTTEAVAIEQPTERLESLGWRVDVLEVQTAEVAHDIARLANLL